MLAASGPSLVTDRVKVTTSPTLGVPSDTVLSRLRSASRVVASTESLSKVLNNVFPPRVASTKLVLI